MKKFISRIFMFAVIVAALDLSFGIAMDYMHNHAKGGGMAKRLYLAREANEEVMLFGSSRMCHHYNPMIIEDSLGMSCFNAGQDGNGIIMSYGFLKMMLERYTPKMIICDLSAFDFEVDDNMKYISLLKPYYNEQCIKEIIHDISPADKLKMLSSLYRYNSLVIRILGSYISSSSSYQKGYLPLSSTMDYDVDIPVKDSPIVDDVKMNYLCRFIQLCKNNDIALVLSLSPRYKAQDSDYYQPIFKLSQEMDIPFIDNYANPYFSLNRTFFQDQTHMNSKGADSFTRYILPTLRQYCK